MTGEKQKKTGIIAYLKSFRGIIVSLTALFVVIPALINSGLDIYKAIAQIPDSIQEKTNDRLFKRHFNDAPVFSQPIEVKTGSATLEMMLDVYENGDILVQYGDFQQWFPFKGATISRWLPGTAVAYAQDPDEGGDEEKQADPSRQTHYREVLIIDIPRYQQEVPPPNEERPATMEKSYLVSRMKEDHASIFGPSSKTYSLTFEAEPGYRIVHYDFRKINAKAFELKGIELADDRGSIRITFSLKSGSVINRWNGWVKGTLRTEQKRVQ